MVEAVEGGVHAHDLVLQAFASVQLAMQEMDN